MEFLTALLVAFVAIVPVELPDKTFVATLVLSTRYRPLPTWLGVVAAFGVQCVIAVAFGALLTKLPTQPVQLVAALLFAVGAFILARGAKKADAEEKEQEAEFEAKAVEPKHGWRAAAASLRCSSRPSGAICPSCCWRAWWPVDGRCCRRFWADGSVWRRFPDSPCSSVAGC